MGNGNTSGNLEEEVLKEDLKGEEESQETKGKLSPEEQKELDRRKNEVSNYKSQNFNKKSKTFFCYAK